MVDFRHVHICNITPALQTGILLRKETLCQFIELVGQVVAVENRLVRCPPNNAVIFVHKHVYVDWNALSAVLIEKWNPVLPWTRMLLSIFQSKLARTGNICIGPGKFKLILKNLASYCCLKLLGGIHFEYLIFLVARSQIDIVKFVLIDRDFKYIQVLFVGVLPSMEYNACMMSEHLRH